jgi:hypothetical protein
MEHILFPDTSERTINLQVHPIVQDKALSLDGIAVFQVESLSAHTERLVVPVDVGSLEQGLSLLTSEMSLLIVSGGMHQLTSFPVSKLYGVDLPRPMRIQFANAVVGFKHTLKTGEFSTRLAQLYEPGTSRFIAWDGHLPASDCKTPHDFYHMNQKGGYAIVSKNPSKVKHGPALKKITDIFGEPIQNHQSITNRYRLSEVKKLRVIKIGGRVFLVVGVLVDTVSLGMAAKESVDVGSAKPLAAQSVRVATSAGMAWGGAKAFGVMGAAYGTALGPVGIVGIGIAGALLGGFLGMVAGDYVADLIYEN